MSSIGVVGELVAAILWIVIQADGGRPARLRWPAIYQP